MSKVPNYDDCMMQEDKIANRTTWHHKGWDDAVCGMDARYSNEDYLRGYRNGADYVFNVQLNKLAHLGGSNDG